MVHTSKTAVYFSIIFRSSEVSYGVHELHVCNSSSLFPRQHSLARRRLMKMGCWSY